jgi:hypothetical protein
VGYEVDRAIGGVMSQLPTTLWAAVVVLIASVANVVAGAGIVRLLRGVPFRSRAELVVGGAVGAVLVDAACLFVLGPIGWFEPLPLALVLIGLLGMGLALGWPWLQPGSVRRRHVGLPFVLLVVAVWSAPVVLQLASPVPPFIDVLPNHVAPVEHLRAYGTWEQMVVAPSPIYGPSRIFLGYVAFLGMITQLTGLSAALAISAFTLPLALLLAASSQLVVQSLVGSAASVEQRVQQLRAWAGAWALLIVPLTFVFLRLPDVRASVLGFVPVAFTLALLASEEPPIARARAVLVAVGCGVASLVHPPAGVLLTGTVVLIGLLSPGRMRAAWSGAVGGSLVALPQVAATIGYGGPAWIGALAVGVGMGVAFVAGGNAPDTGRIDRAPSWEPGRTTWLVVAALTIAVVVGAAVVASSVATVPEVTDAVAGMLLDWWVLLAALGLGLLLVRPGIVWLVIGSAVCVGLVAMIGAEAIARLSPDWTLLVESIAVEVPKAVGYWLPWFIALGAGLGIATLWTSTDHPAWLRVGIGAGFALLAAFSLHGTNVNPERIEQHGYAEAMAIALRTAQDGYWVGHPHERLLIDASGRELVELVQAGQASGRIRASTPILHVAPSFQQWEATPLGVFAGVIETDATLDPERSIHTVGGRLRDIRRLPRLLGPAHPWVVVEGFAEPSQPSLMLVLNGYRPAWRNERAVLFVLAGATPRV